MYEKHFGLKKRPFSASATGTEVFVGPQTAKMMAGLTKALSSCDAIVTVSGPVGAGKSTLVAKAMDGIGGNHKIILVGRMQLDSNDVLELLLSELGLTELPNGTIQKFAAFRRTLKELEDANTRVIIAVEDGVRIGVDALAELEALTAADAGESSGASIVVMGDERLGDFLKDPQLARLRQRVRQNHSIDPLGEAELRGYLMHCLRLAGGDFEALFEADASDLLHKLSNGIPRIANNLVESTLSATAEAGAKKVPSKTLLQVAKDEYNISVEGVTAASPVASQPAAQADPVAVAEEFEIPDLIQDTQPSLPILPEKTAATAAPAEVQAAPKPVPEPVPVAEFTPDPVPVTAPVPEPVPVTKLVPEPVPEPEPAAAASKKVPDWDRDPTFAELKPDLAALELAMALAQGGDPNATQSKTDGGVPANEEPAEEVQEITLDSAISQKIADNLIDEPGEVSPPDSENADPEAARVAAELAKAKTIDDVDDKMAETLFGEELNMAAAELQATMKSTEPANDAVNAEASEPQKVAAPNVAPPSVAPQPGVNTPVEASVAATSSASETGLDLSASERLKTVRALNSDTHPSLQKANKQSAPQAKAQPAQPAQPATASAPKSIEDQISTSLTQTLKALDIEAPVTGGAADDDDDEEETKGGFLSRFKRS